MLKKHTLDQICTSIYNGEINEAMSLLHRQPDFINIKSPKHDNKTLLMCTLTALTHTAYSSLTQQDLLKLINLITQNPKLDLTTTDDFGNTIFHLAFRYARDTDNELSKALFNVGELLLKLIKNEAELKKIVNKKSKSSCKKSQKNFLQYIFPNLQEEILSEQEIENLKHVQKRVTHILLKIFHFKKLLELIIKDPVTLQNIVTPFILPATGVTLSWETWLRIIDNPSSISPEIINQYISNIKFKKIDLIHNHIAESIIKIYKDNLTDEQLLIAKLQDYITINQKSIKPSKSDEITDLMMAKIIDLIDCWKKYLNYINKLTPNKLGLQYDKNKH